MTNTKIRAKLRKEFDFGFQSSFKNQAFSYLAQAKSLQNELPLYLQESDSDDDTDETETS